MVRRTISIVSLVVCTGADLEVGWLPLLLRQAGNAAVQPGQPGNLIAADYVDMLDKPSWLRGHRPLNAVELERIDETFRQRVRAVQAVDRMLGRRCAARKPREYRPS